MLELRTHLHLLDIFKLTVELAWNQWSKEVCSAELSKPQNKLFQFMQRKLRQINWLFLDHWHQGPKTESVHPCWLYLTRNRIVSVFFWSLMIFLICFDMRLFFCTAPSQRICEDSLTWCEIACCNIYRIWEHVKRKMCSWKWWTSTSYAHCTNKQEIKTSLFKVNIFHFSQTSMCEMCFGWKHLFLKELAINPAYSAQDSS